MRYYEEKMGEKMNHQKGKAKIHYTKRRFINVNQKFSTISESYPHFFCIK